MGYIAPTDEVEAVGIGRRVAGFPLLMHLKDESKVNQVDLLFEIDPRP